MRLTEARVPPVSDATATEAQAAILAPMAARGPVLNVFRTVAQDPDAAKAFLAWGGYILSKRNGLAAREREIVILRTGYLCKSGYEWTQHVRIGLDSGLTETEVKAIKAGPSDPSWSALDRLLIQASDELFHEKFIATKTWDALAEHLSQKQLMDLVFTVGQYTLVSMFLNSFGVQLDPGQTLDPELKGF
ncbi:MAG: carboxymuconolactone decarboxylase family protein [Pseudomonadota bacterium]|nr:carboxymuconolactone decarboxylase family protein [Pseudomonadota bacterium]